MAMAKTSRPDGTSSKSVQASSSLAVKANSRQVGKGSENGGVYVNERGQVCYGDKCVTLTVDGERREIVVNVKRDATCNVEPLVEAIRETLGKGCRTVYEVESEIKEK
jgi:hypothetical protein